MLVSGSDVSFRRRRWGLAGNGALEARNRRVKRRSGQVERRNRAFKGRNRTFQRRSRVVERRNRVVERWNGMVEQRFRALACASGRSIRRGKTFVRGRRASPRRIHVIQGDMHVLLRDATSFLRDVGGLPPKRPASNRASEGLLLETESPLRGGHTRSSRTPRRFLPGSGFLPRGDGSLSENRKALGERDGR
jgi:hypothetical protein